MHISLSLWRVRPDFTLWSEVIGSRLAELNSSEMVWLTSSPTMNGFATTVAAKPEQHRHAQISASRCAPRSLPSPSNAAMPRSRSRCRTSTARSDSRPHHRKDTARLPRACTVTQERRGRTRTTLDCRRTSPSSSLHLLTFAGWGVGGELFIFMQI